MSSDTASGFTTVAGATSSITSNMRKSATSQNLSVPTRQPNTSQPSTIRPIGLYAIAGLTVLDNRLIALDSVRGYLAQIDPKTNNTIILNGLQANDWVGACGVAVEETAVWFSRDCSVYRCDRASKDFSSLPNPLRLGTPVEFVALPYLAQGIAISESKIYIACEKSGYIHIFDKTSGEPVGKFNQPGVGIENLTIAEDALWVCDRTEQTVYCLDLETGKVRFSALTPFSSPTGIAFYPQSDGKSRCYVSYADEEPYIRDDPNAADPFQLTFRDRTFIHPLFIYHIPETKQTLSNGYLIELSYVEEMLPLEELALSGAEWRIALPADTLRQKVRKVEAIGHPFTEEIQDGQRVAVFKFDHIAPYQSGLVGWKALIEMYSIKYNLTPEDIEETPLSEDFKASYLIDDDELAMDTPIIQAAAKEAAGTETNILRKMLRIRNYVYDQLSYGIQPKIDTPDIALARGIGSCGEYVGILLALARLNGIACRTIGRYKCPQFPEKKNLPLEPDFNHVWLEFFVPGVGWLPMESNVDDVIDRGPYPTRFFMGLAWYHTELGKGISFAKFKAKGWPDNISLGDFSINHIRFTILEELNPEISYSTNETTA